MPAARGDDVLSARRILFYGVSGAGKSTAAMRLGALLGLPVHLVDEEIGWLPGRQARDEADQREIAARIVAGDRWILDSAYSGYRDEVHSRAELVIALDYPRWLSLGRLMSRTVARVRDGVQICNGNRETLAQALGSDSIIRWHFRSFARKRAQMRGWHEATEGTPVLLLGHPREFDALCDRARAMQEMRDRR
ncbi:adenylate kinase [Propionibacterium cyclohexanicum]|uniref:adenylate kinase n=1 Tax=Propionibacterium cyclohexanicum TaxID=64702 RepID=UPI000B83E428|nr:adenylate kinase [Propionibacterium cyclohexanicum]